MLLRHKVLTFATAGFFGFGMMNIAHAQGLPPDDGGGFEIGAEEPVDEGGLFENLSQYLGVTAGANNGSSDGVEKSIQGLSIKVDLPELASIKTSVSLDVGNYENVYKLELDENSRRTLQDCQSYDLDPDNENNGNSIVPEWGQSEQERYENMDCSRVADDDGNWLEENVERTVDDSFSEVTEGYIQWEPTSFATLRVGRQPIVLGQFEAFSPLMFTTPLRATGTKTRTSKADKSYAQDGFQLSLFPISTLEVSYTQVPKMRIDPANKNRFEEFALLKGDFTNFAPTAGVDGGQIDPIETLEDVGENELTIVRAMYYGENITFGFTSMEGAETNEDPLRDATLQSTPCANYFDNNTAPSWSECANNPFTAYYLGDDKGLRFGEMEATAVEFSYRMSPRWTLVFETTTVENERELDILPYGATDGFEPQNWQTNESLSPIYADLIQNNNGKGYINMEITMSSVGMVYKGDRWLLNLQLAQRTEEGADAQAEAWRKALDPDEMEGEGEEGEDTLPILNAVRLLGAEKEGYAGFGFGSFGQNFGFGLSAGWRFFEKLEIGGFAGMALDVTGADEIEAEGYETPESDAYASFGINYLF